MPAEHRGAAGNDVAHGFVLIAGQTMALPIRLAMRGEDVGDLEAGPDGRSRRRVRPDVLHGVLRAGRGTSAVSDAIERALLLGDVIGADVRVARRAANRAVSEELLDDADVGAVFEQMSGEGVTQ